MLIVTPARRPRPRAALGLPDEAPAGSLHRCAIFAGQDVCSDPFKPERKRSSSCGAVEKRACVFGAVRAKARYFGRGAIVAHPGDRAANNSYPNQFAILYASEREQMPDNRLMVTVQPLYERISVGERNADMVQSFGQRYLLSVRPRVRLVGQKPYALGADLVLFRHRRRHVVLLGPAFVLLS